MTEPTTELKTIKLTLETKALLDEKGEFVKSFRQFECPKCKHTTEVFDGKISYIRNDYTTLYALIGLIDSSVVTTIKDYGMVLDLSKKAEEAFKSAKSLFEKEKEFRGEIELTVSEAEKLGEYIKIIVRQFADGRRQGAFNRSWMYTIKSLADQIGIKD